MRFHAIFLSLLYPAAAAAQVDISALSAEQLAEQYPSTAGSMVFSICPAASARHDSLLVALMNTARTDHQRKLLAVVQPLNRARCNDERMNRWVRAQLTAVHHPSIAVDIMHSMVQAGADEADKAAIRSWLLSGTVTGELLSLALQTFTQGFVTYPSPLTSLERLDLVVSLYDRVELTWEYLVNEFAHLHRAGLGDRLREALLDRLVRDPQAPSAAIVAAELGRDLERAERNHSMAWRARFLAGMEQLERAPPGEVPPAVQMQVRSNLSMLRPRRPPS